MKVVVRKRLQPNNYFFIDKDQAMNILVFKTNILYREQMRSVKRHLEEVDGIVKWNVDFWDEDRVLRVVTDQLSPREVENHLRTAGYFCEELPD